VDNKLYSEDKTVRAWRVQRKRASATRKQRRLEERKARKAKKNDGQNDQ
jgi:hypothetical protein